MLKDIFKRSIKNKDEPMEFNLRGNLEIIGERNGEVVYYDAGDNVVTLWAKHASMHLMTSESYSSHGNMTGSGGVVYYSGRSIVPADHTTSINIDGTLISSGQYFEGNTEFYTSSFRYLNIPNNMVITPGEGDQSAFNYPFFPTKMLFGTGMEYTSWAAIPSAYTGPSSDTNSYAHYNNGGWTSESFNSLISDNQNYYSNQWNGAANELFRTRTVSDITSNILAETPIESHTGISGAIKDGTYNNVSEEATKTVLVGGKRFLSGSYRGIGRPSFIYARRGRFYGSTSETKLSTGTSGSSSEFSENKITYTVVMPEQPSGEFYPYNGYTLKTAGLFCDARMVLGNVIPTLGGTTDYVNYAKMCCGIVWAKRNIAAVYKTHDLRITARWSIYLP